MEIGGYPQAPRHTTVVPSAADLRSYVITTGLLTSETTHESGDSRRVTGAFSGTRSSGPCRRRWSPLGSTDTSEAGIHQNSQRLQHAPTASIVAWRPRAISRCSSLAAEYARRGLHPVPSMLPLAPAGPWTTGLGPRYEQPMYATTSADGDRPPLARTLELTASESSTQTHRGPTPVDGGSAAADHPLNGLGRPLTAEEKVT
jgi:hypothetical protein